jgi:hypothetical protein
LPIFRQAFEDSDGEFDFFLPGITLFLSRGKAKRFCPPAKRIDRRRDFKRLILGKGVCPTTGAIVIHKDCLRLLSYPETMGSSEDVVLFALYTGKSISHPVVRKHKREGSLRSDKQAIVGALEKAPNLLFDPSILPMEYFHLKHIYEGKRYVEKAMMHDKNDEFYAFRQTYHQAVRVPPMVLLKPRFLKLYLRTALYGGCHRKDVQEKKYRE